MIKTVRLKNFQSHKDSTLNFDPGVNVIIGDSRSGKTSILRALNWNRYNKPAGVSLNSYWNRNKKKHPVEAFESEVVFDNGNIIRKRSSDFNGYIAGDIQYEALGQAVPEEIEDVWNMSEVNIQKQFDSPFLISESAAEVARFFNKVIKLDKIDKVLSSAEKKRLSTNREIKELSFSKEGTERELKEMEWTDKVSILIESAERRDKRIIDKKVGLNNLEIIVMDLIVKKEELESLPLGLDELLVKIEFAESLDAKIEDKSKKEDIFKSVVSNYFLNKNIIEVTPDTKNILILLEKAEKLDIHIQSKVDKINLLGAMLNSVKEKREDIIYFIDKDIEKILLEIEFAEIFSDTLKEKKDNAFLLEAITGKVGYNTEMVRIFSEEIIELEDSLPDVCVLCGQQLNRHKNV